MINQIIFQLLRASLFTGEYVEIQDLNTVFKEMKEQTVAGLPGKWLKKNLHNAIPWQNYCSLQQGIWVRVMHAQEQVVQLLEKHNIPCVIIKGAAASMYYPYPDLRTMGDVDILVKRCDQGRASDILEENGYKLTSEKKKNAYHYCYSKDEICFELHRRLPIVGESDEKLLTFFEKGIDNRVWCELSGYRFPTFRMVQNGLVLIFHIKQHLRSGLGLRQIIDWMMYVNGCTPDVWNKLVPLLKQTGMDRLAFVVTVMCQKNLGLTGSYFGLKTIDQRVCDDLLSYIMEKGNFGRKAGLDGRISVFTLYAFSKIESFRRLQRGGLMRWKLAKKYRMLRPFAWIYQSYRILREFIKNSFTPRRVVEQRKKGKEHRNLIEALGLRSDNGIKKDR